MANLTNRLFRAGTQAALALVELGTNARPAIPILIRDLDHPNHFYRERAADTLAKLRIEPDTVARLDQAAQRQLQPPALSRSGARWVWTCGAACRPRHIPAARRSRRKSPQGYYECAATNHRKFSQSASVMTALLLRRSYVRAKSSAVTDVSLPPQSIS